MIVDSGCNSNLIGRKSWAYLRANNVVVREQRTDSDKTFVGFDSKTPLKVKGRFKADLCFSGGTTEERFYVVEADDKCILGGETAKKIGILKILTNK